MTVRVSQSPVWHIHNVLFCGNNSPKPRDVQSTVVKDEEIRQIFTFKKLEPVKFFTFQRWQDTEKTTRWLGLQPLIIFIMIAPEIEYWSDSVQNTKKCSHLKGLEACFSVSCLVGVMVSHMNTLSSAKRGAVLVVSRERFLCFVFSLLAALNQVFTGEKC